MLCLGQFRRLSNKGACPVHQEQCPPTPNPPPTPPCSRTRATTGAAALGVVAILIWAGVTLLLFLLAASNGQLHKMTW